MAVEEIALNPNTLVEGVDRHEYGNDLELVLRFKPEKPDIIVMTS